MFFRQVIVSYIRFRDCLVRRSAGRARCWHGLCSYLCGANNQTVGGKYDRAKSHDGRHRPRQRPLPAERDGRRHRHQSAAGGIRLRPARQTLCRGVFYPDRDARHGLARLRARHRRQSSPERPVRCRRAVRNLQGPSDALRRRHAHCVCRHRQRPHAGAAAHPADGLPAVRHRPSRGGASSCARHLSSSGTRICR